MSDRILRVVTATRLPRERFSCDSLLGRSLWRAPALELSATYENTGPLHSGLSELYNNAIGSSPANRILLFVHDDVYLHEPVPVLLAQLELALERFDVVGLAGSRGSAPDAVSWGLDFDERLEYRGWQSGKDHPDVQLSGIVSHANPMNPLGDGPPPLQLSIYGDTPMPCTLLDGLFLAAKAGTLQDAGAFFDPMFRFHLYDLDFCRTAASKGLRLGTWPLTVTHASGGGFDSADWKTAAMLYRQKWCAGKEG